VEKKARILIVEDEAIVAEDLAMAISDMGYEVAGRAVSAEQATRKALELRPDLILMDIVLKGKKNGIDASHEIKKKISVPIIFLTAYSDTELIDKAKSIEPYAYIIKPFQEKQLFASIEMALYKNRMEKKLKESEERLSTTLRSINDGVIATDPSGCVILMNPVAEALTGWKEKEAVGKSVKDIFQSINEETGRPAEDPVTRANREGVVVGLANYSLLIAKDGTKLPIDDRCAPIRDDKGNITGVVLVFYDITEQKRIEEEARRHQNLESIGVLAGGIAHDFNNILTIILGNISLAKMYAKPEDKVYKSLVAAENGAMRAKDLTQQLLTFSKGGAPVKKTSPVAEFLKKSVSFALSGSNVKCMFSIPDDIWAVEIDKGQINQAFNNLVINADEAMPEGGILKISVENITITSKNILPLQKEKYVKISFEDNGIGIPSNNLNKIFDPYFSTKTKGNGLGLASAYSIIKSHKGLITVESELGVGTTFYIYLSASEEIVVEKKAETGKTLSGKRKILIMDDEDFVREVVGEMVKSFGYSAEFAKDGAEAIDLYGKALKSEEPFAAVIMDLTIPGGMGGKEAIQELLKIDPNVKAIVSSGYSSDPIMSDCKKYGFVGMLSKPYKISELGKTLKEIIGE
jgi:PAS domain S-box-containing protein